MEINGHICHIASKYSFEDLDSAADQIDAGTPISKVLEATGMSYSPVWRYATWRRFAKNDQLAILPTETTDAAKAVSAARAQDLSWGEIGVKFSIPESRARKLYSLATNIDSVGTRTGKGGRFWGQKDYDAESRDMASKLYTGTSLVGDDASAHGPQVTVGTTFGQALSAMDPDQAKDLRKMKKAELAELVGYEGNLKDTTKAELLETAAEQLS